MSAGRKNKTKQKQNKKQTNKNKKQTRKNNTNKYNNIVLSNPAVRENIKVFSSSSFDKHVCVDNLVYLFVNLIQITNAFMAR